MIEAIAYAGNLVITISTTDSGFHWKALDHGTRDVSAIKVGEGNGGTLSETKGQAETAVESVFGQVKWLHK